MKIISKFKDYYDSIAFSQTPVWERKTTEILLDETKKLTINKEQTIWLQKTLQELPKPRISSTNNLYKPNFFMYKIVGFCGVLIPIFLIFKENCIRPTAYIDIDEFKKMHSHLDNRVSCLFGKKFEKETVDAWKIEFNATAKLNDIFLKLQTPIFILEHTNIRHIILTTNPKLANINFQRIINPYQTYQQIEMYLLNELATGYQKTPEFSDEIKRDMHGFNEWSFKKRGIISTGGIK